MPSASPTACASRIIFAASARVGAKRQMSSSVAWVSALTGLNVEIAPELRPDFGADVAERRRLEAGAREELRQRRDARGLPVVDLGEREAIAFDVPDHAGAVDLRRRIADGGDDGVDRQMVGDHAAWIDALEATPSYAPPCLRKYHQGMPFCAVRTIVDGATIAATSAAIGVS